MYDLSRLLQLLLLTLLTLLGGMLSVALGEGAPTEPRQVALQDGGDEVAEQEEGDEEELTPLELARRHALERQRAEEKVLFDTDGDPVLPGQLPAAASEAARARWQGLLDGILAKKPIESFVLAFYLRQRNPERPQSNDVQLTFSFLAPGFLRAELTSGRTHLRGPDGDFLLTKEEVIPIAVGREGSEDRKQIDEMAAIARNFIGLTDPRTLRIASLEILEEPPTELPHRFVAEGKKLAWLAVKSPDFYLYRAGSPTASAGPPLYLARLGIDPESQEVHLAIIHRDHGGTMTIDTAKLVRLRDHVRRDGYLVPHKIDIYDVDTTFTPWRFRQQPTSELTLRRKIGRLGARLTPKDFEK